MRNELIEPVMELTELAIRLNRQSFNVFVNYSGHVNNLSVRVFPYGWERSEAVERNVYLEGTLAASPQRVSDLSRWLESLSRRAGVTLCPHCREKDIECEKKPKVSKQAEQPKKIPLSESAQVEQPLQPTASMPEKRQGQPNVFTPEGKAELVSKTAELRKAGKTIKQMADELRIPIGTISHLTWEYQIKPDGTVGGKRDAA